ncbi:uncharacterized protein THITE_43138 [Thermothielavioides terrestris NRRL 8126]|uniref:Uncharacterized protein n=1 Tax=Thermothielavioides terrestris (strain ATCC 38088 / NRRL 8126) TaxID=578455 RepID=G2RAT8_THETT|nr:uncharacterized protein THITE_43138 [Thermothielavioides terrestris NRRL 8126]AEO69769.1 hypothetical protein THITE_43138 [Thermothielavioides terrestris NRRL 8126]
MNIPLVRLLSLAAVACAAINWDVYEYGVVPSFQWSNPFPSDGTDPGGYDIHCKASGTFHARLYKLRDLPLEPPLGLAPWEGAISDFISRRDYPGSWDGVDHKGLDREVVVMEWVDVPAAVRDWIEEQQRDESEANDKKWLFGVFEKPRREGEKVHGTVPPRPTAPVGSAGSSSSDLHNLAKYKSRVIEHGVLAWPVDHTKPDRDKGQRDMTFKIQAMSVSESEDGKRARLMWEKLHRAIKRNERRQQREERLKARKEMEEGRVKDEL